MLQLRPLAVQQRPEPLLQLALQELPVQMQMPQEQVQREQAAASLLQGATVRAPFAAAAAAQLELPREELALQEQAAAEAHLQQMPRQ